MLMLNAQTFYYKLCSYGLAKMLESSITIHTIIDKNFQKLNYIMCNFCMSHPQGLLTHWNIKQTKWRLHITNR